MMVNMARVGKHFVNIDEISYIQYVDLTVGGKKSIMYSFVMKNGQTLRIDEKDFEKFIEKNLSYLREEK